MRQTIRQGQQLVMTQQLQQAIKLLQLSSLELAAYIDNQIESNPLLEIEDPSDDGMTSDRPSVGEDSHRSLTTADRALESGLPLDTQGGADSADDNLFSNDDRPTFDLAPAGGRLLDPRAQGATSGAGAGGGSVDRYQSPDIAERRHDENPPLRSFLHEQLALSSADTQEQIIGRYLIDTLEDSGYLSDDLQEIGERLGCSTGELEAVLPLLQDFDPPGVFARSLAECLAIQLRQRDRYDPAMQALVENLDMLVEGNVDAVKRRCGVNQEDFEEMMGELRALDPKPGLAFDGAPPEIVVPDVFVTPKSDGTWAVELNSDALPRVLLNRHYYAEVKAAARSKEDRAYLSECFGNANWLIRALDQRAQTILKVSSEIVRQQEEFFLKGVGHLKPLTLHQVAEEIGMHESTVSRVTASKYLTCPSGTFELKYFFTSAINAAEGGDAHSAESVRQRIKSLVDSEDAKAILSDDKIVTILRGEDIDIARRTVAKYRDAMRIPSSVQRRRIKAMRL